MPALLSTRAGSRWKQDNAPRSHWAQPNEVLCSGCCPVEEHKVIPQALCAGSCQLGNAGLQPAKAHYLQPHHTPPASSWLAPACAVPGAARAACPTSAACPPFPAPWESPEGPQGGSAPGRWATQSCKSLLSLRALGGILIRVKIISSIFWLRK